MHCLRSCILAGLVAAALPFGSPAEAQLAPTKNFKSGMGTGFGYAGVLPGAELGVGVFHFLGSKPYGVFADAKFSTADTQNHEYYCPDVLTVCDVSWVLANRNDQRIATYHQWLAFNGGVVIGITRELALMLGGGMAREKRFEEYFDDEPEIDQRITRDGHYFVDDTAANGWKPQGVGAAMLRLGPRLVARFGYETAIKGGSIGFYIVP